MLVLHTWGPVAHLPSLDPECLAAIAYLNRAVPPGAWTLVRANDPSVTPAARLPALLHNATWTTGYPAIVAYLARLGHTLDRALSPPQRAAARAHAAHLAALALPLLDYLYSLPPNHRAVTLPAYRALLPFPLSWTVPGTRRAAALERLERSGVRTALDAATLDLETAQAAEPQSRVLFGIRVPLPHAAAPAPPDPAELAKLQAAQDVLLQDPFAAIAELLAPHHAEMALCPPAPVSSLDCLAYAYLALLTDVELPQNPAAALAARKFPALALYVRAVAERVFPADRPVEAAEVTAAASSGFATVMHGARRVLADVVLALPAVGPVYVRERNRRAICAAQGGVQGDVHGLWAASVAAAALGVAGGGYWWWKAVQPLGRMVHTWVPTGLE